MVNGQVVGRWKRTFKKETVIVSVAPFNPLTRAEGEAIQQAAEQYARVLGLNLEFAIAQAENS